MQQITISTVNDRNRESLRARLFGTEEAFVRKTRPHRTPCPEAPKKHVDPQSLPKYETEGLSPCLKFLNQCLGCSLVITPHCTNSNLEDCSAHRRIIAANQRVLRCDERGLRAGILLAVAQEHGGQTCSHTARTLDKKILYKNI